MSVVSVYSFVFCVSVFLYVCLFDEVRHYRNTGISSFHISAVLVHCANCRYSYSEFIHNYSKKLTRNQLHENRKRSVQVDVNEHKCQSPTSAQKDRNHPHASHKRARIIIIPAAPWSESSIPRDNCRKCCNRLRRITSRLSSRGRRINW